MTSNCNSQAFIHEIAFEKNVIEVITGGSLWVCRFPVDVWLPVSERARLHSSFHYHSLSVIGHPFLLALNPCHFHSRWVMPAVSDAIWCHLGAGVSVYNSFDVWCAVEKCWFSEPLLPIVAFSKTALNIWLNIWRHSWHASFVASSCFKLLQWLLFCAVFCQGLLNFGVMQCKFRPQFKLEQKIFTWILYLAQ